MAKIKDILKEAEDLDKEIPFHPYCLLFAWNPSQGYCIWWHKQGILNFTLNASN